MNDESLIEAGIPQRRMPTKKPQYVAGFLYGGTIADEDRNIKNETTESAKDDKFGL